MITEFTTGITCAHCVHALKIGRSMAKVNDLVYGVGVGVRVGVLVGVLVGVRVGVGVRLGVR